MRTVCRAPDPLYKPRLGQLESHNSCKQGDKKAKCCSKQRTSCRFNHFCFAVFTMWKAAVLAVCLLVAGVQPLDDPTYGVKLCGREFIRAVIFTCGGSRWKRSLRTADVSEDPFSSRQEESSEGLSYNPAVESILQRNRDQSFTERENHEGVFSRSARSFISDEILEALRKADRKGRDVVVGLSNACCKWGCSKSEISSLC
ncbi:relaxin-3-like [Sebastes umbrosus]|uniref:relaxin-3-like n=1 Tax=Sebastes umbrosus TaxID=72105 RepID=UPI00189FC6FD|nr:relaxin-3-like [Sebastes umbrosus]